MSADNKKAETGVTETHEREFLESFARAVLSWQYVEHNLFLIFSAIVRGRDHHLISAAYHSIFSLRAKLGMADAVAQLALVGTDLLSEWKTLKESVEKRSKDRNELAHHTLMGHFEDDGSVTLRISPSVLDSRIKKKNGIKANKERDIASIKKFEIQFDELAQKLDAFGKRVATKLQR